jgi:hypothetical protein
MCVYKLCLLLPFIMLHTTIYTCANAITQVRHMFNEIIIPLVFKVDLVDCEYCNNEFEHYIHL